MSGEDMYVQFLEGDEIAFEGLVELYQNELFLFINDIVHDYHEAKYLMIDAFAILASGNHYAGKSSLKTYLFGIGKNLAYGMIRGRKHDKHISFTELVDSVADTKGTPEQIALNRETISHLHEAMLLLKLEYRFVLLLLYFDDMSYRDAGKKMKKSEQQVKVLAHRAKVSLRSTITYNK